MASTDSSPLCKYDSTSTEQVIYKSTSEIPSTSSKYKESEFTIKLRGRNPVENSAPADLAEETDDVVLCVLWKNGKLGAAYYSQSEMNPEYMLTRALFRQTKPNHTITIGTVSSQFVTAVTSMCRSEELDESVTTDSSSLPQNLQLLKINEYKFDACRYAVMNLKLPGEPANATDQERDIYLNSIINFNRTVSVQALGALLMFLNKYQAYMSNTELKFLFVNTVSIQDVVLMDSDTFEALQIFNSIGHPAFTKRGRVNDKEGLSIFSLFNRCRSFLGQTHLRALLQHPTNNVEVLAKRQQFIEFCIKPINSGIIKEIQASLKYIHNINNIISKIHGSTANLMDWKRLCLTLQNVLLIYKMCVPHADKVFLFRDVVNSVSEDLVLITQTILHTIDFENCTYPKQLVVKYGIDPDLDKKKRYREELKEKITLAASYELRNLPEYINDCLMVYIPEIGYLVSIQMWSEHATFQELEPYGLRHYFTLGNTIHFKSAVCDELDRTLGDIHTIVSAHESRIILRLSQHVYDCCTSIKRPLKLMALLDALMSMAEVAGDLGYVKPELTAANVIEIEDGRHPLLELCLESYVPNSYVSGCDNSHLKIITGPNASGKSIYIKQNALIVYLAHLGSFVPAKSATIGMMFSIHTHIQSIESATTRLSTFMIDLRQISQALYTSTTNSLIVIDEFGKGTTEFDGLALLASMLEAFLIQEEHCPHIVVSTHFLLLTQLIPESAYVEHLNLDFRMDEEKIVYLYRLVQGVSASYAAKAAETTDISKDLIVRSKQILELFNKGLSLKYLKD